MITANMTNEQLEAYTLHLRIEEISQKLRINDVVPADGDRFVLLFVIPLSITYSCLEMNPWIHLIEADFILQISFSCSPIR